MAIRRVPFEAPPKRRAVGSKVTISMMMPSMGSKDREYVRRHVEQPGRRALEQVDAALAVFWPALAWLAARLPHVRVETDLEYDVLRRQPRAFGHALGGDGLDVGAVDGPDGPWRWSPHLLKRERHEIACSTRVHNPSHVSIRCTRLGVGAGAEHWVSTFEYAHKDVHLLLAVELRLAAKQRQCDRMLRRAPIHVAILAGLQPVASDARLAHAHFVPGPGPAAVTSHLSGAHDAHSLLGYIIDREHYRHLGVWWKMTGQRGEPAERSRIPVYLCGRGPLSKFRRENAFRRASARKGKSARVLLRCSFTVGSRTGPLWAHLGPITDQPT